MTYIYNMRSILIEQDVRLKIELARPASSVVETWSVQPARGAPERSFDETPALRSALASACGTYSVHLHKPIIIKLLSDTAHDSACVWLLACVFVCKCMPLHVCLCVWSLLSAQSHYKHQTFWQRLQSRFVCVCVSMFVCMCVYVVCCVAYVCIRAWLRACMRVRNLCVCGLCMRLYVRMCARVCVRVWIWIHGHIHSQSLYLYHSYWDSLSLLLSLSLSLSLRLPLCLCLPLCLYISVYLSLFRTAFCIIY